MTKLGEWQKRFEAMRPTRCDRCDRAVHDGDAWTFFFVASPVGYDAAAMCAQCYVELVPPMAQIELVRCGTSMPRANVDSTVTEPPFS